MYSLMILHTFGRVNEESTFVEMIFGNTCDECYNKAQEKYGKHSTPENGEYYWGIAEKVDGLRNETNHPLLMTKEEIQKDLNDYLNNIPIEKFKSIISKCDLSDEVKENAINQFIQEKDKLDK